MNSLAQMIDAAGSSRPAAQHPAPAYDIDQNLPARRSAFGFDLGSSTPRRSLAWAPPTQPIKFEVEGDAKWDKPPP